MRKAILYLWMSTLILSTVAADTIVLKSGAVFNGKVEYLENDPFYLKISGSRISFTHSEVAEIRMNDAEFDPKQTSLTGTQASPERATGDGEALMTEDDIKTFDRLMRALKNVNNEDEDSGLSQERQVLISAIAKIGPKTAEFLERALKHGSPQDAPYVLNALVLASPSRGAVLAQEVAKTHPNSSARAMAVQLLGDMDANKHSGVLSTAAKDPQGNVRMAALQSLAGTKNRKHTSLFIDALEDRSSLIRSVAIFSLQQVTGERFSTKGEWAEWYEESKGN